ncbi:hypothetical protein [Corynebacterium auriscanis]|uniref:hypothetical protein n=1 Tax=Corynebacterium auriscanis TaxID=99807 RepID=UPI003CF54D3F
MTNNNSFGGPGYSPQQGNAYPQQPNGNAYPQQQNGNAYPQQPNGIAHHQNQGGPAPYTGANAGPQWAAGPGQQSFNGLAKNASAYSSIDGGRRLEARNQVTVDHNDARQDALVARTVDRARRRRRLLTYTALALVIALVLTIVLMWIFSQLQ